MGWRSDGPPVVPRGVWLALALVGGVATEAYRYAEIWTPLQRHYLAAYVGSAVAVTSLGEYDVWQIVDKAGARLALDEDLVSVTTVAGETSFALAAPPSTVQARLVSARQTYPHTALHAFLRRWIYRDQTVLDLLVWPPLWTALALVLGGVIGTRAQAVVDARASRPQSAAWSATAVIIDHVDRPRARPPLMPAHTPVPPHPGLPPTPAAATPSSARDRLRAHTAAPASWPEPFFK
jgi:hypothetical protein